MFIMIRIRNDSNANIDCYQYAKKYPHFTIMPYSGKKLFMILQFNPATKR